MMSIKGKRMIHSNSDIEVEIVVRVKIHSSDTRPMTVEERTSVADHVSKYVGYGVAKAQDNVLSPIYGYELLSVAHKLPLV